MAGARLHGADAAAAEPYSNVSSAKKTAPLPRRVFFKILPAGLRGQRPVRNLDDLRDFERREACRHVRAHRPRPLAMHRARYHTMALTRSPSSISGTPITAASSMSGCSARQFPLPRSRVFAATNDDVLRSIDQIVEPSASR